MALSAGRNNKWILKIENEHITFPCTHSRTPRETMMRDANRALCFLIMCVGFLHMNEPRGENEWHPLNALLAIDLNVFAVGLFHAAYSRSRHAYFITILNNSRVVINHIHLFHQVKQKYTVQNVRRSVQARFYVWLINISIRPAFNAPNVASHWQLGAFSLRIPSTIA